MDWLIILLTASVSLIKLGQGFDIDFKNPYFKQADPYLVIRSVVTVILLVPALFLLMILIFHPQLGIIITLIIIAGSPAGDLSIQQVTALGGNVALASLVQMICALLTIITTPLLLQFYEMVLGLHLDLSWSQLFLNVAVAQSIPMLVGITVRSVFPQVNHFPKFIMAIAKWLLLICFVMFIIENYSYFTALQWQGYLIIVIVTVSAFILGVIMAGRDLKNQISLAIESSLRNPGLAYLIASENFAKEKVTTVMLPYLVVSIATMIVATLLLKRLYNK